MGLNGLNHCDFEMNPESVPKAAPRASIPDPSPALARPVPAREEKYHKVVFENDWVRVIDVQIPPGEQTDYHTHDIASVMVYLTESTARSQPWGESTFTHRQTVLGFSRYAAYDEKPLSHRVMNAGTSHFRTHDIELIRKSPDPSTSAIAPPPDAKIQWSEKLVRSSTVTLQPGISIEMDPSPCAHLLIGIRGITTSVGPREDERERRDLGNGDFRFFPPNSVFEIANLEAGETEALLLELR